jgi:hypothetical protein
MEERATSQSDSPSCAICGVAWYPKIAAGDRLSIMRYPCGHLFDNDCVEWGLNHDEPCPVCGHSIAHGHVPDVTDELLWEYRRDVPGAWEARLQVKAESWPVRLAGILYEISDLAPRLESGLGFWLSDSQVCSVVRITTGMKDDLTGDDDDEARAVYADEHLRELRSLLKGCDWHRSEDPAQWIRRDGQPLDPMDTERLSALLVEAIALLQPEKSA